MSKQRARVAVMALVLALVAPVGILTPAVSAAPAAPTLTAPAPGAAVTTNPVLSWISTPGAVSYRVQVSTDASFGSFVHNELTANTRYVPPLDLNTATYHWRVQAIDSTGDAGPFASRSFVKSQALGPELMTPAAGAIIAYPAPVILSWTPMPGIKDYIVQIDDDINFVGAPAGTATVTNSFTLVDPPPLGTTQYWRVQGRSSTNVLTQQSEVRSFTLNWTAAPAHVSPPSGTVTTIEEITLDWAPLAGARAYEVQISADEAFSAPIGGTVNVETTAYSPPTTLPAGSYFWRVRGLTTTGQPGPWTTAFQFTRAWPATNPDTLPNGAGLDDFAQVQLLLPLDNDVTVVEPVFSWTPQRGASAYEIDISFEQNFSSFNTCTTNHTVFSPYNQCEPANLNPGTFVYWRVRARDGAVFGEYTPIRRFLYDPVMVEHISPVGGAAVNVPVLRWEAVDSVSVYRVNIQPVDPSCGSSFFREVTTTVWVPETLPLSCNGEVRWFVQSVENDADLSRILLSPALWPSFTMGTPPAVTGSLDPVTTTGTDPYRPPLMSWNPIAGAATYQVMVSEACGGCSYREFGIRTNRTAFSYTDVSTPDGPLFSPGDYEFFVRAYDAGNVLVGVSAVYPFHIDELPAVELLSPPNCPPSSCEALRDTPTLDWVPVPGAGGYVVYLATDQNFTNIVRTWWTRNSPVSELTPLESLPDSQAGQAYYWFVRPCILPPNVGCGPPPNVLSTEAFAFRKESLPLQPLSPVAGSTVVDEVTFEWTDFLVTNQATDPSITQEARNYQVTVSTDAGFTPANIVETSPLVDQTTYTSRTTTYPEGPLFWRVQAFDNSGNPLTMSATTAFTLDSTDLTLVNPAHGADVNSAPVLQWAPMPYTATYQVEVYRNVAQPLSTTNRIGGVVTVRSTATSYNVNLPAGTYGWRVRRVDFNGNPGPWSAETNLQLRQFDVVGPAATLTNPANGATIETNPLLLQWLPVATAARYRVEASTSPTFDPMLESLVTDATAFAPDLLTPVWPNATIYWRVVTLDSAGTAIATSAVRNFIKDSSTSGEFAAVTPFRLYDTRETTPLSNNQVRTFDVTGMAGSNVPDAGVSAVVMNVTVVSPTMDGWLTVYPNNVGQPNASNLNFRAGQTVANLVTVGVDPAGRVRVHNAKGTTHVILDIVGYYSNGSLPRATRYTPATTPTRILDTRIGSGGPDPLFAGEDRPVEVAGEAGVPADATAVVMNVTAVSPTVGGFFTLYPDGQARPLASNINFVAGAVVPNLVVVPLGATGDVAIYNAVGSTHAIFDVVGWYEPGDPADGARLNPVTPARIMETRVPVATPFASGETRPLQVRGAGGVPNSASVTAVVLNVTVVDPIGTGWITVFPTGAPLPTASNLNYVAGQTVPNLVVARVGAGGQVTLYAHQGTHLLVDVVAYFNE